MTQPNDTIESPLLYTPSKKPLKMYIFVKASLPSHKMIAVAHGVLMAHLKFEYTNQVYRDWLNNWFRKVICEVTDDEFEQLKKESADRHVIVTESALEGKEVAIVFCPRLEWPAYFKSFKLSEY